MIKFKKPATGKEYKLAYNAGDVVDLGPELEKKLIEDGYAVPSSKEDQAAAAQGGKETVAAIKKTGK